MKHFLLFLFVILGGLVFTTSCDEKKEQSSENALAEMIEEAAEKKAARMEKKRESKDRERILRAEREEAEEELRMAREEAAEAREEAAEAREEARRAQAAANSAVATTSTRVRANIPGARLAHVIREGGYTNARSGPGVGYSIMNKVRDGSPILYTGSLGASWVEVYTLDGRYLGYMSSNKIAPEQ